MTSSLDRALERNHFALFDLATAFDVDRRRLEKRFLELSRLHHPDFHQLSDAEAQSRSLQDSAALNEAYRILKDPFLRAEYLLALLGGPSAAEQREMPPAFLLEVLELRERIEEVRAAGRINGDEGKELQRQLVADRDSAMDEVGRRFGAVANKEGASEAALIEIRRRLNIVKYLDGLLRELGSGN